MDESMFVDVCLYGRFGGVDDYNIPIESDPPIEVACLKDEKLVLIRGKLEEELQKVTVYLLKLPNIQPKDKIDGMMIKTINHKHDFARNYLYTEVTV